MIHQERINEIKNQITENRAAAGYYAAVAKVVEKWSGKVYNKRMAEDMNTATNGAVCCEKTEYNRLYIAYRNRIGGRRYFIPLCHVSFEKLENKRINPDVILPELREMREELLKDAQAIENTLLNLDALIRQIETLKKTCRALYKDVPYVVLDAIGESRYTLKF